MADSYGEACLNRLCQCSRLRQICHCSSQPFAEWRSRGWVGDVIVLAEIAGWYVVETVSHRGTVGFTVENTFARRFERNFHIDVVIIKSGWRRYEHRNLMASVVAIGLLSLIDLFFFVEEFVDIV